MTLTVDVPDALARRIQSHEQTDRARFIVNALSVYRASLRDGYRRFVTPLEALALPADVHSRLLQARAEAVAPYYEADLALPPHERELTAFTALDGVDTIHEES